MTSCCTKVKEKEVIFLGISDYAGESNNIKCIITSQFLSINICIYNDS